MDYQSIKSVFRENTNTERGEAMSAYLRNQFPCLGISSPLRKEISKEFLKEKVKSKSVDWEFIHWCFEQEEREFQYLATDYLRKVNPFLLECDTEKLELLILTKSWWDTVDALNNNVGFICLKYPHLKEDKIANWIEQENFWLKRISIIFQLTYRRKTDSDFLARAILYNANSKEFFVNKAIGWALRQYARTHPEWVAAFLEENVLHPLSVREARKYLPTP